ncbi:hypothetical protein PIROE2DRAFT_64069 [Piromyces sp. E2]|nr:hypothetical protein PIROE2DRAFT_64069 [Piromyces sp. E2]|eukprot:OUM58986.1 hypothetical protein PIROE2DRAFT_64069 [Piromyces sp. E2]
MKLFERILIGVSIASTVLSNTLSDISFKIDFNSIQKTPECQSDFDEYKQCFALFNYGSYANNFKEVCDIVYSENCQEFYEDPLIFLPNCQDSKELAQALDTSVININLSRVGAGCKTDENGILCPIANSFFNGESIAQNYNTLFESTCKSLKCKTALIDALKGELAYAKDAESLSITSGQLDNSTATLMNRFLNDLNSDKCSIGNSETKNMKNANETNDYPPISFNNTLLLLFAINLTFLFFF